MPFTVALAGNPNCGKSTLFNALTGEKQHIGNFPGITVEKKTATMRYDNIAAEIVDLPGIYSLIPFSPEEKAAVDELYSRPPDVILNIVDASNLERSLYLTIQLAELGIPMIIAFNMTDLLQKRGIKIDYEMFRTLTGIAAVPVSASKRTGLAKLRKSVAEMYDKKNLSPAIIKKLYPDGFIPSSDSKQGRIDTAKYRYRRAEETAKAVTKKVFVPKNGITDKIDRIVLNKFAAIPILVLFAATLFLVSFGSFGKSITYFFESSLMYVKDSAVDFLTAVGTEPWITGLLTDGIISGVGSVLSFLPQIALLFFFLSFLEDSGYMARAAFITDRPFRTVGLSGRSFVPLFLGFGCTVPAVMASRIIELRKSRIITILTVPFMSCSAKMPVYALFGAAFFGNTGFAVIGTVYLAGIVAAVASASVMSGLMPDSGSDGFMLELPEYKLPTMSVLLKHISERLKGFIIKAGTVLLLASTVIWFLGNFDTKFTYIGAASESSLLCCFGKLISPVFSPLGFGSWQPAVAVLSGLVAKEAVVSSLGVTTGGSPMGLFTPASAISFMVFVLLYTPCTAALSAIAGELGSKRKAAVAAVIHFFLAWAASFIIYRFTLLC